MFFKKKVQPKPRLGYLMVGKNLFPVVEITLTTDPDGLPCFRCRSEPTEVLYRAHEAVSVLSHDGDYLWGGECYIDLISLVGSTTTITYDVHISDVGNRQGMLNQLATMAKK